MNRFLRCGGTYINESQIVDLRPPEKKDGQWLVFLAVDSLPLKADDDEVRCFLRTGLPVIPAKDGHLFVYLMDEDADPEARIHTADIIGWSVYADPYDDNDAETGVVSPSIPILGGPVPGYEHWAVVHPDGSAYGKDWSSPKFDTSAWVKNILKQRRKTKTKRAA